VLAIYSDLMVLERDFMRGKWMKMVVYWEFPMDFQ
jgi:hypothetical protein